MTHLQKSRFQKRLLVLCVAGLLSACGGGSAPGTSDPSDGGLDAGSPVAMPMSGTIVMEERNGKTVFDGWFMQADASEHSANTANDIINQDSCEVSSVASVSETNANPELGAALPANELVSVGPELTIDSRVGQFEALVKQEVGATTVYAPENRWQSVAVPDDAVLSFESGSIFSKIDTVKVAPLMPLVWLAPETGVMTNAAASLRWEASFNEQVKIKLRLSAIDFSQSENPEVVTIACDLIDDGLYTLPAEYQQQLPDDGMGIVVYAVRERVQQIDGVDSSLKVVQLSYPAPVKR